MIEDKSDWNFLFVIEGVRYCIRERRCLVYFNDYIIDLDEVIVESD